MYLLDFLLDYRQNFIRIGKSSKQTAFLRNSFLRWYFNAEKTGIFPLRNIINGDDLKYANTFHKTAFDIDDTIQAAELLHENSLKVYLDNEFPTKPMEDVISFDQLKHIEYLFRLCNDTMDGFEEAKEKLINVYSVLGFSNIHLSIPPIFKGIELFGSPLNTHNDLYCSPFEFEKQFNSLGSFFDYKFDRDGIYICNPPYDENLLLRVARKIDRDLDSEFEVTILITLPVWDTNTQKKLDIQDYQLHFEAYDIFSKSPYLKEKMILDKKNYKYYDYFSGKKVAICYTHFIILSNLNGDDYMAEHSIQDYAQQWFEYSSS